MTGFIESMKNSGIIQKLRAGLSDEDKLKFDEHVEQTLKEYNSMWLETQPEINEYHSKVNKHADQPKGKPGRDIKSSDK